MNKEELEKKSKINELYGMSVTNSIRNDENLLYIRKFSKITLKSICDELGISKTNIYTGKVSKDTSLKIRRKIESEIAKLYLQLDIEGIDIKNWKAGE